MHVAGSEVDVIGCVSYGMPCYWSNRNDDILVYQNIITKDELESKTSKTDRGNVYNLEMSASINGQKISGDNNKIHYDKNFCSETHFKSPLAYGQSIVIYVLIQLKKKRRRKKRHILRSSL